MKELKAHRCEDTLISRNGVKRKKNCPNCNEDFEYYFTHIPYKIDNLHFCSWSCKCAYQRKLDEEKRKEFIKKWRKS